MFILIFFILLVQTFSFWLFEPFTAFLTHLIEIRILPFFILLILIFLFSTKNND